jgi:NDP-sugar pyrophosphorylase family protein
MDAARIGDYTRITDSILGRKVVVESTRGNPTTIESNSVVGNAVHIGEGCRLINTKINPGLTIPSGTSCSDIFLRTHEDIPD